MRGGPASPRLVGLPLTPTLSPQERGEGATRSRRKVNDTLLAT